MPKTKTKRPRRRAYVTAKGGRVLARVVPDSVLLNEDPLIQAEERLAHDAIRYADTGHRPPGFERFEVDPRLGDLWFRKAAAWAFAVQVRAMARALAPHATPHDLREANVAARAVQDRLFGKPLERMAVAGRVRIEFGGLNPDVFPQEARAAEAEVVDIDGASGTEVEDG